MRKFAVLLALATIIWNGIFAQVANPVKWTFESKIVSPNIAEIKLIATIDAGYHMYGVYFDEGGPIPTSFNFTPSKNFSIIGKIKEVTLPEKKRDVSFDMDITMHNGKAIFTQQISIKNNEAFEVDGYVEWMACTDKTCLPPSQKEFKIKIDNNKLQSAKSQTISNSETLNTEVSDTFKSRNQADTTQKVDSIQEVPVNKPDGNNSLLIFFLISLLAGLAGTITPCVFPMIPMTVSFFLRGNQSKTQALIKGLIFGVSIVVIYTLIGFLVSLTSLGANFASQLSSHWIPNSLFFILFVIFAASFLGMFEMVLPGSIVNKADQQADKGGYLGIIFMALATVLVSFSCTGPIVGALLVEATGGLALKPIIGMFGFGLAFALPFTFFAIFPTSLKSLPKSGGWLNSVKVVLGLVMLAFSMKFMVNIDQTYNLNLLSREVFLGVWIAIAVILGIYLLGKLQFSHDSEVKHVTVPRLFLAIISFAFAIYLATGLGGSTLSPLASMLPPATEKRIVSETGIIKGNTLCSQPKYADKLHLPYGIQGYFDLKEGLACAKEQNKPVFIDFKGHSCSNCKIMEASVWSDPEIQKLLKTEFIVIALYTDDKTEVSEADQVVSILDGKKKKTIGQINSDIQISQFKSNALPYYVIANQNGNSVVNPIGFENDIQKFKTFLEAGIKEFNRAKN
jgi:thiol:disulfide interchange protein